MRPAELRAQDVQRDVRWWVGAEADRACVDRADEPWCGSVRLADEL
jgi:hypothetical protein